MKRRDFLSATGLTAAYSVLATQLSGTASLAMAADLGSAQIQEAVWQSVQSIMGYSDKEMEIFQNQPRTKKIVSRFENLIKVPVIIEVKKSHGCIAGHKIGDFYIFPRGGFMDTKNSSPQLCPFLMPPMTRIMWILQERVWEGLEPLPLYAAGQCDDVGLDCNGWGRVVVEARIMKSAELKSLVKEG